MPSASGKLRLFRPSAREDSARRPKPSELRITFSISSRRFRRRFLSSWISSPSEHLQGLPHLCPPALPVSPFSRLLGGPPGMQTPPKLKQPLKRTVPNKLQARSSWHSFLKARQSPSSPLSRPDSGKELAARSSTRGWLKQGRTKASASSLLEQCFDTAGAG